MDTDGPSMWLSPAVPIFLTSWGWGLSFQGLLWPSFFLCYRTLRPWPQGTIMTSIMQFTGSNCCHDNCVLISFALPTGHHTESASVVIACYQLFLFSGVQKQSTWPALYQMTSHLLSAEQPGLEVSWRKRSLCCSGWRAMDPCSKILIILLSKNFWMNKIMHWFLSPGHLQGSNEVRGLQLIYPSCSSIPNSFAWLRHQENYTLIKKLYILVQWPLLCSLVCLRGPDSSLCWGDGVWGQLISRHDSHFFFICWGCVWFCKDSQDLSLEDLISFAMF